MQCDDSHLGCSACLAVLSEDLGRFVFMRVFDTARTRECLNMSRTRRKHDTDIRPH